MSLTHKQAVIAIQSYFNTNWSDTTPVIWGDDDPSDIPNDKPWIRFNILHNEGFQATMGSPASNRFERRGIITIQIFQPENKFGTTARDHASTILDLYSGLDDGGIYYFDANVREVGNDGNGWYQVNVVMTFRYEQIT